VKVTIEHTEKIVYLGHVPARIWGGHTEDGTPVLCFITLISPQTHDAQVNEQFACELQEVHIPSHEGAALGHDEETRSAADRAVAHLVKRVGDDPVLAYYFDPISESMKLLTAAYADANGLNIDEYRAEYYGRLRFERPCCTQCRNEAASNALNDWRKTQGSAR
jgi:hypothetical protein